MKEISTVGLDIAKSVFQVHAISKAGEVVVRRQLKRRPGAVNAAISGVIGTALVWVCAIGILATSKYPRQP